MSPAKNTKDNPTDPAERERHETAGREGGGGQPSSKERDEQGRKEE